MAATAPPVRVPNRNGEDIPAVAVPEHADRAKGTRAITNIEDIGRAVVQENTNFALPLQSHEIEHLGESRFRLLLTTEFSDDGSVLRRLEELSVAESSRSLRLLCRATKPCLEVVADVADLDRSFRAQVQPEVFAHDERLWTPRNIDSADVFEDSPFGNLELHRPIENTANGRLAPERLHQSIQLADSEIGRCKTTHV